MKLMYAVPEGDCEQCGAHLVGMGKIDRTFKPPRHYVEIECRNESCPMSGIVFEVMPLAFELQPVRKSVEGQTSYDEIKQQEPINAG